MSISNGDAPRAIPDAPGGDIDTARGGPQLPCDDRIPQRVAAELEAAARSASSRCEGLDLEARRQFWLRARGVVPIITVHRKYLDRPADAALGATATPTFGVIHGETSPSPLLLGRTPNTDEIPAITPAAGVAVPDALPTRRGTGRVRAGVIAAVTGVAAMGMLAIPVLTAGPSPSPTANRDGAESTAKPVAPSAADMGTVLASLGGTAKADVADVQRAYATAYGLAPHTTSATMGDHIVTLVMSSQAGRTNDAKAALDRVREYFVGSFAPAVADGSKKARDGFGQASPGALQVVDARIQSIGQLRTRGTASLHDIAERVATLPQLLDTARREHIANGGAVTTPSDIEIAPHGRPPVVWPGYRDEEYSLREADRREPVRRGGGAPSGGDAPGHEPQAPATPAQRGPGEQHGQHPAQPQATPPMQPGPTTQPSQTATPPQPTATTPVRPPATPNVKPVGATSAPAAPGVSKGDNDDQGENGDRDGKNGASHGGPRDAPQSPTAGSGVTVTVTIGGHTITVTGMMPVAGADDSQSGRAN